MKAALAIGAVGMIVGVSGVVFAYTVSNRLNDLSAREASAEATNERYYQEQVNNDRALWENTTALHQNTTALWAKSANDDKGMVAVYVDVSCASPWFSPEQFSGNIHWINFGRDTAKGVNITLTFTWSGSFHVETASIGDVSGLAVSQLPLQYSFETGGCSGVRLASVTPTWT